MLKHKPKTPHNVKRKSLFLKVFFFPGTGNSNRRVPAMGIDKPKTIQIDFDLFEDLYVYSARHAEPDDLQYKRITMAVKKKLNALMRHVLYTLYKAGASEEIRNKARDEYLDAADIMESFRWSAEQDVNVTHDKGMSL